MHVQDTSNHRESSRDRKVSPSEGKCGVTESMAKLKHWSASIELVGASRWVSHTHVEEGELVHIVSWVLYRGV